VRGAHFVPNRIAWRAEANVKREGVGSHEPARL